jgi:hypothetical protein
MRRIFREDHLAVNVAMVGWQGEGMFRRYGWQGAKSVPPTMVDADERGRPAEAPAGAGRQTP